MKKPLKIIVGLIFILGALQFLPVHFPEMVTDNESSIEQHTNISDELFNQIKSSCFDCHSNASRIEWYHKIRPASWIVKKHIDEGKSHVNFSEWTTYDLEKQNKILEECAEEIEEGKMPMKAYLPFHSDAKLSDEMKLQLIEWFKNGE